MAEKRHTSEDSEIGRLIRLRRMELGLSQTELGNVVGITFQQIQKYERGTNRVAASRLRHIAQKLDVPISFFLGPDLAASNTSSEILNQLDSISMLRMVRAYSLIQNVKIKQALVVLIEKIAREKDK